MAQWSGCQHNLLLVEFLYNCLICEYKQIFCNSVMNGLYIVRIQKAVKWCKFTVSCGLYTVHIHQPEGYIDCTSSEFKYSLPVAPSNVWNHCMLQWSSVNTISIFLQLKSLRESNHCAKPLSFTNKMQCETMWLHENFMWSRL